MNPVRAGMVATPADYRFASFGRWAGAGHHPFEDSVLRRVMPRFRGLLHVQTVAALKVELQKEFARITGERNRDLPEQIETAIAHAAEKEPFSIRLDRRVRYWVDGLVIGSELFVKETMARARGSAAVARRRLVRAVAASPTTERPDLFCFKQLRVLLE